jgi:hypothetical protein
MNIHNIIDGIIKGSAEYIKEHPPDGWEYYNDTYKISKYTINKEYLVYLVYNGRINLDVAIHDGVVYDIPETLYKHGYVERIHVDIVSGKYIGEVNATGKHPHLSRYLCVGDLQGKHICNVYKIPDMMRYWTLGDSMYENYFRYATPMGDIFKTRKI